jgi:prephenate dehydratase
MSNKPMSEIKRIYSHPQSFAQCKSFIAKHVPNAELIPVESTARGVIIAKENNEAAIGTALAAKKYDMKIMRKYIEDNPNNYTRFLVLSKKQGNGDKTSVVFSIKNDPGSLYDVLKAFSDEKINLTKIESRPSKRNPWEYIFYVDFEGNIQEKHVKKALQKLQNSTIFFKNLGSYPSWEER